MLRCLTVAVWLCGAPAAALERPELLPAEEGCERWLGGARGNDPTVRLNLLLCRDGDDVTGRAQWSSLQSGHNVRELRGRWDGQRLELADVRIVEEHPQPGWRFCTIDRWELVRDGASLSGRYVASECDDRARVELSLLRAHDDSPPAPPAQPPEVLPPAEERERDPPTPTETPPPSTGCSCDVPAAPRRPPRWPGALVLLCASLRSRALRAILDRSERRRSTTCPRKCSSAT